MEAEKTTPETPRKKTETKGIVLMAFGKRGYYYAAFNMALTIKKFAPKLNITLIHDGKFLKDLVHTGFFDKMVKMKDEDMITDGKLSPAKAKISVYKYLKYDHNLYLDVDGILLKDITPLLDRYIKTGKPYLTEVRGSGKKNQVINYSIWTTNKTLWKYFDLDDDTTVHSIQSSHAYIRKSDEAKEIFDTALKYYKKGFDTELLTMQWGGTVPDELMFSGACAKLGYNPKSGTYPIFFGWKHVDISFSKMAQDYFVLSLYGNGKGVTLVKHHYIEHYDRLMRNYARAFGMGHIYKTPHILRDKHAG